MRKRKPMFPHAHVTLRQAVRTAYGEFAVHGVNLHDEPVLLSGRLILQLRGT